MTSPLDFVVVPTGVANLASVLAGLRRAGAAPRVATDADDLRAAPAVLLPGVGAFDAGRDALDASGAAQALRERIAADRPTLAICLGLQLLLDGGEESPELRPGLGIVRGVATRFSSAVRVPQLGWNHVEADSECVLVASGHACFANSFRLATRPPGFAVARASHDGPFIAALERGNLLACQFHPELSGAYGHALLQRFVERAAEADAVTLARRVIPCLDVRDGRVVKGVRFAGLRDAGDPVALARCYEEQGADELVVLDVSATPDGRRTALDTVAGVRAVLSIPLTVGGGVRREGDATALLEAGADKVAVNTAAVREPGLLDALAARFGVQCTVLALDAAEHAPGAWEVVVRSGSERTGRDAVDWAREAVARGAGEILLTSWDRDGTRAGYDVALTAAIAAAVTVPVIASGGADSAAHMAAALAAGADAVLAASIFHAADTTVATVKELLAAAGVEVRR